MRAAQMDHADVTFGQWMTPISGRAYIGAAWRRA
jgi:hypothetical protein